MAERKRKILSIDAQLRRLFGEIMEARQRYNNGEIKEQELYQIEAEIRNRMMLWKVEKLSLLANTKLKMPVPLAKCENCNREIDLDPVNYYDLKSYEDTCNVYASHGVCGLCYTHKRSVWYKKPKNERLNDNERKDLH